MVVTPDRRRVLLALLVVLAVAVLLAALFPEVRADFGLGGDDKPVVGKTKQSQVPARAPARPRARAR